MADTFNFSPGPSPEVQAYFANKGLKPSFSWLDVWAEEHAHAFTVAKATQLDVLSDIRSAVQKAIDEGQTFQQFKKDLAPVLQGKGWWGKQIVTDPATGQPGSAQLGSPRRLKVIYEAIIRSARAAGAWERAQRTKALLPYLEYRLGPSVRHRPHHASKSGLVLPIDDPFWSAWYPPNGWGCKCWTRQITRAEARRRGGVSAPPEVPTRPFLNKRTGEVSQIPVGIDPGWHTNPGQLRGRNLRRFLSERLEAAPKTLRDVAVKDMVTSWLFRRVQSGAQRGTVPAGVMPAGMKAALKSKSGVVLFSDYTARKAIDKHPDVKPDNYRLVQQLLDAGEIIRESEHVITFQALIDGRWWRAVIKATQERHELYLSTFHRINDKRRRQLLRRGEILKR